MRNIKGMGFLLLAWAPMGQASLNAALVSAALNQPLAAVCNLLSAQQADWGNINAVVRSARVCLQHPAEQRQSDRISEPADSGLAQRSANPQPDLIQSK